MKLEFKHRDTQLMKCDSAIYEGSKNSFIAYSNVEINENDSLKIYGDSLTLLTGKYKRHIYMEM